MSCGKSREQESRFGHKGVIGWEKVDADACSGGGRQADDRERWYSDP